MAKPLTWLKRGICIASMLSFLNPFVSRAQDILFKLKNQYQNLSNWEIEAVYNTQTKKDTTDFNGNASLTFEKPNAIDDIIENQNVELLSQSYPNPTNSREPKTHSKVMSYEPFTISYFSVTGKKIASTETLEPGIWEIIWGGRNDNGLIVADGVYVEQYKSKKKSKARKLTLLDKDGSSIVVKKISDYLPPIIEGSLGKAIDNKLRIKTRPLNKLHQSIYSTIEREYDINENQENNITLDVPVNNNAKLITGNIKDLENNNIPGLDAFAYTKTIAGQDTLIDLINNAKTDEYGNYTIPFINSDGVVVFISDSLNNWYNLVKDTTITQNTNIEFSKIMKKKNYEGDEWIYDNEGGRIGIKKVTIDFLNFFKYITDIGENSLRKITKTERWQDENIPIKVNFHEKSELPKEVADSCRVGSMKIEEQVGVDLFKEVTNEDYNVDFLYYDISPYSGNTRWREFTSNTHPKFPLKVSVEINSKNTPKVNKETAMHELEHVIFSGAAMHSPYIDHLLYSEGGKELSEIETDVIKELYTRPNQTNVLEFNNDHSLTDKVYKKCLEDGTKINKVSLQKAIQQRKYKPIVAEDVIYEK